mgnify:CR=1 FL=1
MFTLAVLAASLYGAYAVVHYVRKEMRHARAALVAVRKELS